jgi:hypothetical protein
MKRVLVVSNGCFSLTDSNGRTLSKLFSGYEPSCLAQVYTYGTPDFLVCKNYYKMTDKSAIKSFVTRKPGGYPVASDEGIQNSPLTAIRKKTKRTPFRKLVREFIWKYSGWYKGRFMQWLEEFSPEAVLVFAGDGGFIMDCARVVAERFNIPVLIYTTEDYYFKDYNYLTKRKSLFYKVFYNNLKKAYKKLEKHVAKGFFNTPMLTECYASAFSFPCECLFARSDIEFVQSEAVVDKDNIKVSYLGNLGLKRHLPLMDIADALAKVVPGAVLDVYGAADDEVKNAFDSNPNISYKGFVNYEDVVDIIHNSDLVVHAEYDEPFNIRDLKAAFSTKIPDSVSSGTPLLMYANESLACTDFLLRNECAFVATGKAELEGVIEEALFDKAKREKVIATAKKIRDEYFVSDDPMVNYFN